MPRSPENDCFCVTTAKIYDIMETFEKPGDHGEHQVRSAGASSSALAQSPDLSMFFRNDQKPPRSVSGEFILKAKTHPLPQKPPWHENQSYLLGADAPRQRTNSAGQKFLHLLHLDHNERRESFGEKIARKGSHHWEQLDAAALLPVEEDLTPFRKRSHTTGSATQKYTLKDHFPAKLPPLASRPRSGSTTSKKPPPRSHHAAWKKSGISLDDYWYDPSSDFSENIRNFDRMLSRSRGSLGAASVRRGSQEQIDEEWRLLRKSMDYSSPSSHEESEPANLPKETDQEHNGGLPPQKDTKSEYEDHGTEQRHRSHHSHKIHAHNLQKQVPLSPTNAEIHWDEDAEIGGEFFLGKAKVLTEEFRREAITQDTGSDYPLKSNTQSHEPEDVDHRSTHDPRVDGRPTVAGSPTHPEATLSFWGLLEILFLWCYQEIIQLLGIFAEFLKRVLPPLEEELPSADVPDLTEEISQSRSIKE